MQDVAEENLKSLQALDKSTARQSEDFKRLHQMLKKRGQRIDKIVTAMKELKFRTEHGLVYNPDATLVVKGIIDKNVMVQISGKKIPVQTNMKGVVLSPFAPKGIMDMGDTASFVRLHPTAKVK